MTKKWSAELQRSHVFSSSWLVLWRWKINEGHGGLGS